MKKFALSQIAILGFSSLLLAQQQVAQPAAVQPPMTRPADAQQDAVVEEIVARVNNAIITRADLRRNKAQSTQDAREQNLSPKEIAEREQNALRDLIDQQLLIQKAAELGITADAEVIKRLDDLRKQMKVNSLEELQKVAEGQGVVWEDFKQNIKHGILSQKVIGAEVGSHIQLTQTDLQKYYDEHKSDFSQPERVRLSEILIANDPSSPKGSALDPSPVQVAAAQEKANDTYQELKDGASFDELARKLSNGPTAEQGGDLGYFKRNDLAKELETQTFSLKAGEFTKPIRTRQGFIILLVNDHIDAGTPTFDRVREQIQERLYTERIQPALREYLTKLRDEAYIDVKPGYTDSGASPNQTHLVWATDAGPRTKQVRSKMGLGKKKTVIVSGEDANRFEKEAKSESAAHSKAEKSKKKEEATVGAPAKPAASAANGQGSSASEQAGTRPETKAEERARWKREDEEYKAKKHPNANSDKTREAKADKKKKNKKSKESAKAAASEQTGSTQSDAKQAETKQQSESSEPAQATQQSDTTQAESAQPDSSQQTESKQQADTKPEKKKKFSWF